MSYYLLICIISDLFVTNILFSIFSVLSPDLFNQYVIRQVWRIFRVFELFKFYISLLCKRTENVGVCIFTDDDKNYSIYYVMLYYDKHVESWIFYLFTHTTWILWNSVVSWTWPKKKKKKWNFSSYEDNRNLLRLLYSLISLIGDLYLQSSTILSLNCYYTVIIGDSSIWKIEPATELSFVTVNFEYYSWIFPIIIFIITSACSI